MVLHIQTGSVVGLLVGASIIQTFGWHATFLAIIPFSILVTLLIAKFVREYEVPNHSNSSKNQKDVSAKKGIPFSIDIKGIVALSVTIASFLIALTVIQIGVNNENVLQIAGAFIISAVSLSIFVIIERRAIPPFVNLKLLRDKILLPSFILLIATGISMFMIYPTIVQLVRSPAPLGFGGDSIDAAHVQLPFMNQFLGVCKYHSIYHK